MKLTIRNYIKLLIQTVYDYQTLNIKLTEDLAKALAEKAEALANDAAQNSEIELARQEANSAITRAENLAKERDDLAARLDAYIADDQAGESEIEAQLMEALSKLGIAQSL